MSFKSKKLAVAISLLAGSYSFASYAEQDENLALEEVTVYAQKRAQSILEVPVSVASYDADLLDQAQVRDLSDLQQVAPSLVFNSSTGATQSIMTIRGIGTAGQNSGLEQSVGVFIDGVYRGRPGAALGDFVDIESVEVLRGPQGTLFGRNTSAGVISVRSQKPSYETGGNVSMSAGDYGYKQIKASATGPLIEDKLAYRLSATWQERDGFVENAVTGDDYNNKDRTTVRAQVLWDIDEDTSLRVMADYTDTDEVCCAPVPVFYGPATLGLIASPVAAFPGMNIIGAPVQGYTPGDYVSPEHTYSGGYADIGDYKTDRNDEFAGDDSIIDGGISFEYQTALNESLDLTAIVAHRFFETSPYGDTDMTSADIWRGGRGQDIDENSFELRLSYSKDNIDWTAGLYYFDQKIDATGEFDWGEDAAAYLANVGTARLAGIAATLAPADGAALLGNIGTYLNAAGLMVGAGLNPAIEGSGAREEINYEAESLAAFGQATWHINEDLSWTFGLRYSEEEKKADYVTTGDDPFSQTNLTDPAFAGGLDPLGFTFISLRPLQLHLPVGNTSDKYDDDNVSVATSVNYQLSETMSVYGRYAQGYKAGGLNLNGTIGQTPGNPVANLANNDFDAEETESFEVGLKSFLLDRTLQLNATVFYQTVEDFQTNSFDGVGFTLHNAGEIEGKGIEIDYTWTPSENWILTGGLVLQDIEYADFDNGSTTMAQQEAAGLPARATGTVPPQDLTGETPNFVSDITYAGSITYLHELNSDLMLKTGTSYRFRSDYTTGQDNDEFTENDDYWIINANITLAAADESWAIELWGKNLTDEEVINIAFDTPLQGGSFSAFMDAPMTWGVTGRMNF